MYQVYASIMLYKFEKAQTCKAVLSIPGWCSMEVLAAPDVANLQQIAITIGFILHVVLHAKALGLQKSSNYGRQIYGLHILLLNSGE